MTTLLDKQRSVTSNVQSPAEAALDQLLSRITALAPMVARLVPDIEHGRRLPAELVSALQVGTDGMLPAYGRLPAGARAPSGWWALVS